MAFSNTLNSQFQYMAFIAGGCHTADEAYRVLMNQLTDRERALKSANAGRLRREAARMKAQLIIDGSEADLVQRMDAKADLLELDAHESTEVACYEGAEREVGYLKKLIEEIRPLRKYSHLPDHEAFEACQREEWLLEFCERVENYSLSMGRVPPDQLNAMRQHPDWHGIIFPYVKEVQEYMAKGQLPPRSWRKSFLKNRLESCAPQHELMPAAHDLGFRGELPPGN